MDEVFKIVKIIDSYSLVINGGSEAGLSRGNKLEVFESGKEVIDPDTKESLGTLDFVKAHIEVTDAFPKMCVCKHLVSRSGVMVATLSSAFGEIVEPKELNVDSMDISGGYEDIDKKIKVGDKVRRSF